MRGIAGWTASAAVLALMPVGVSAQTAGTSFDRLVFSADGSSLTGTNGGGGGSITWLHNFDADKLIGVAAEHQVLSVSHWSFGSLTGSVSAGSGDQRYTFYGEAHEGAGDDGGKAFKYHVEALGLTGTYFHRLSATLEDRQINVETTRGNLPKVGLSYLWSQHVQTALSYQYSFGGNLGTQLTSGRIDVYGPLNFLGGFAVGQASPTVLGLLVTLPPHDLREGYVGVSKHFALNELTFIVDYQHLSGGPTVIDGVSGNVLPTTRWTGTLNYTWHLSGR
ncbi:MAG TPA: hypothetical protein VGM84_13265 [Steroidobacteraceae bacterium]|jgi:hypothetical protein